jgi:hypothetical protein
MMKTKKPAFLIFMVVAVVLVLPVVILKVSAIFHRRGFLPGGVSREITMAFPEPGKELELVQAHAEIRIPVSASDIHACIGCVNPLDTRVRFNLPPPDFPLFIKSTYCDRPFTTLNPCEIHHEEQAPEWWQPGVAAILAECTGGNSFVEQQIMVDKTDQKSHIIYVITMLDNYETPEK